MVCRPCVCLLALAGHNSPAQPIRSTPLFTNASAQAGRFNPAAMHVDSLNSQPTSATPLFSRIYSICSRSVAPGTMIWTNCD